MSEQQDQRPIKGYPDSLGPDIRSGGVQEPGGLVPPYEGRKTGTPRDEAEQMASVFTVDYSNPAPKRKMSKTERKGVSPTDTTAASALGVGQSRGRQGNEKSLRWSEKKHEKSRLEYGVSRNRARDTQSPTAQVGDQGG